DTVAMQEDCTTRGDTVTIPLGLKPGANRRRAGEDVRAQSVIVPALQCLRAADIAAIASAGIASVTVRQRLRIGLVSTGDEIVQPGAQTQAHQVYDANRPMLRALLDRPYAQIIDLGHCDDDPAALRTTLSEAAKDCDLIVTSGGASRGQEDHLFDALAQLGHAHVWQIAIKPGRPMLFGQFDNTVLMALPGNPVAAMVCCLLYGRAIVAHLCGAQWAEPLGYSLPSAFSIEKKKTDRREFLRSWRVVDPETGVVSVQKFSRDGSGLISGLQAAEGLTVLPETVASVEKGEAVRFIPFSDMEL
ncbi:MAG: molybdopterin molybdotransferase MoeA, partial [Ahrensia sp.]